MQHKKIGVWGLGITGKSVLQFLAPSGAMLGVMDKREPSPEDSELLKQLGVQFYPESQKAKFFKDHEIIVPSGGIDLRPYLDQAHKWIAEIDLFQEVNKLPLIAITGSLGKTSVTTLLSQLLALNGKVLTGGNIGTGMLDLVNQKADYMVLELSSFQLEIAKKFAPDLAIWTNFFANHLDRHGTMNEYFNAKFKIISAQNNHQQVLLPIELYDRISTLAPSRNFAYFSSEEPTIRPTARTTFYYVNNGAITKETAHDSSIISHLDWFPDITFPLNWIIVSASMDMLGKQIPNVCEKQFELPDHRLKLVKTINNIDYYDDSKSTVMESTIAAIKKLSNKPVIALIGGLSKGANREPLFKELKPFVKAVVLFGAEAETLKQFAEACNMPASQHADLPSAFLKANELAKPGDQIVLSPAGSSFDLFANYHERGEVFKHLIADLVKK